MEQLQDLACFQVPLRDRFGIPLQLDFYEPKALQIIITKNSLKGDFDIDSEATLEIAKDLEEHQELQSDFLKRILDFAIVMDKKFITLETVKESLDLMRIDSEGLDDMDRKYMNCIIKNFSRPCWN